MVRALIFVMMLVFATSCLDTEAPRTPATSGMSAANNDNTMGTANTPGARATPEGAVTSGAPAEAARLYVVKRVVDGDTIKVQGVGTIRLIGVDTPETVHPKKPVERFGREASRFTKELLTGKKVRLEYDFEKTDRYNRVLAYVYLEDGTLVNAEIIKRGYGHAYTRFPFKRLEEFRKLERDARLAKRGLWADAGTSVSTMAPGGPGDLTASRDDDATVVFITASGAKYHKANCGALKGERVAMTVSDAKARGLEPCKRCQP